LYDPQYGDCSGGANYIVACFVAYKRMIDPHQHIRKSDEKGSFLFAKDYEGLRSNTKPLNNGFMIKFSNKIFTCSGTYGKAFFNISLYYMTDCAQMHQLVAHHT
jgi:hypothetical protein